MKKTILIFTVLFFVISSFKWVSKKDSINEFNFSVLYNVQRNNYESNYTLQSNGTIALWEEITDLMPRKDANVSFERIGKYMRKKTYSSILDSSVLSNIEIMKHKFFIKEDIPMINWELSDSTELVLGYRCSLAKANFRGRDYTAFYTNEIMTNVGPWKLHGLPGLVLKVESNSHNEYYRIEALELKTLKSKSIDYEKKFDKFKIRNKRKFISWNDFKSDVTDFIDKVVSYHKSNSEDDLNDDGGRSGFRLMNYLEIFHPAQTETIWYD